METRHKMKGQTSKTRSWAEFRHSVIGQLLSNPPEKGVLGGEIEILCQQLWQHPITNQPRKFSFSTIERWYYRALRTKLSPVEELQNKVRSDEGLSRVISEVICTYLKNQYEQHNNWSYQLHSDNLQAHMKITACKPIPSYSSVRRCMQSQGWVKKKRNRNSHRPGYKKSEFKKQNLEVRSYENAHVGGLWHLDFHCCSREVITEQGELVRPWALGIIDDRSRLLCHIQWYLVENAENLTHGFIQALQKRGMPRSLLTDNGSAMLSQEFTRGLKQLSIIHETTLPYSPYQNGKQEVLWAQLEGRLLAMVENKTDLRFKELNDLTLAWCEFDYNKATHREIKTSPLSRFLDSKDVLRPTPDLEN